MLVGFSLLHILKISKLSRFQDFVLDFAQFFIVFIIPFTLMHMELLRIKLFYLQHLFFVQLLD